MHDAPHKTKILVCSLLSGGIVGQFLPGPCATWFLLKLAAIVNGHQPPGSRVCAWTVLYVTVGPELRHSAVLRGGNKRALI